MLYMDRLSLKKCFVSLAWGENYSNTVKWGKAVVEVPTKTGRVKKMGMESVSTPFFMDQ